MADISKITIPNGSGTNTYDLKDSEAREGLLSTVKYTEQSLTSEQQAQARENIGAAASTDVPTDAVKYTAQTLTDAQKTQARTNIGAGTSSFSGSYGDLTNAPPLVKGSGTGGDMIGGTGVNQNSTRYTNSVAYGNLAAAIKDYAIAFGNRAFAGTNRGGKHAVAIGDNVRAEKDYEWAIGKCNQSNSDTAFSIGDGTSDSDRHNLIELKTNGTLLLNGNAVKTEGGDDNKLRLGQIVYTGSAVGGTVYGFAKESSSTALSSIQFVLSYSDRTSSNEIFGDFVVGKDNYACIIQPIKGRTAGKPTTGAWILVENCYKMFYSINHGTQIFTSCNLSMLDTSEVKDMTQMFAECAHLKTLDISSFDMTNVTAYNNMFGGDTALTTLKTPKINPHDDIPLPITLYSQDGTAYTNLPVTTGTSIELRQSWT